MAHKKDLYFGILWGLVFPIAGFVFLLFLFQLAEYTGLMEETTSSIAERRLRTISLLAICLNIIPLQWKKRRNPYWIRGITSITMVLAIAWVLYFRRGLFVY